MGNVSLVEMVYREISKETFGDAYASQSLTLAYTQQMLALTNFELNLERHRDLLLEFNETAQSHRVF